MSFRRLLSVVVVGLGLVAPAGLAEAKPHVGHAHVVAVKAKKKHHKKHKKHKKQHKKGKAAVRARVRHHHRHA